ncbi:hypothetical protein H6501_02510 [Candidatus Woesearchaeota archaeon]|nr:hypothetical protein [Nanoarchaeota archaeon]MCB9370443.1 hypothetical protein [Candidatus Woesearchaeota archaeon]USN43521.1 MAG: hypothetical protein H6500_03950 [Candidatus Woesearchaeota archaeon]
MTLEHTSKIDVISESEDGQILIFKILDSGSITDPSERYKLFTHKLKTYVDYIISENFQIMHSGFDISSCSIQVICMSPPTPEMLEIHKVCPKGQREKIIPITFETISATPQKSTTKNEYYDEDEGELERFTPRKTRSVGNDIIPNIDPKTGNLRSEPVIEEHYDSEDEEDKEEELPVAPKIEKKETEKPKGKFGAFLQKIFEKVE